MKARMLFLLMGLPLLSSGQYVEPGQRLSPLPPDSSYLYRNVWRLSFLDLSVVNEQRFGKTVTFVASLGLIPYSRVYEAYPTIVGQQANRFVAIAIHPVVSVGVRRFYNFERRLLRGKSIRYNSGNYLMLKGTYILPSLYKRDDVPVLAREQEGASLAAMWGFQRTYRRNFYLNLALGLSTSNDGVGGALDFALGYTFPQAGR